MKTKKPIIAFVAGIAIVSLFSFKLIYEAKKSTAEAEQQQGLYIFILNKPVLTYDYLGSVKKTLAWSGQPEEMLNSMIKKVKKDHPNADGIIFTTVSMDKADAIKFK